MPRRKDLTRQRWFSLGADALQLACPTAPRCYGCPLCIRGFSSPDSLTVEDVPPKSVGGRPLVLTCKSCNNTSGHLLDSHIRSGRDLQEIAAGTRDAAVCLTQFGQTVNARATLGPSGIVIHGLPEKSNPKAHQAWREGLEEAARTGSRDWNIQLGFSIKHRPSRESVGWLRVAYLYAFAALGYRFVMRPELERIREQIRRPDDEIARQVIKNVDPTSEIGGISFVYEPTELRSILVRLGRNLFFFPDLNRAVDFYDRLENVKGTGQCITLSGTHMELPRRPAFAFDFQPSLMIFTLPPSERGQAGRERSGTSVTK